MWTQGQQAEFLFSLGNQWLILQQQTVSDASEHFFLHVNVYISTGCVLLKVGLADNVKKINKILVFLTRIRLTLKVTNN